MRGLLLKDFYNLLKLLKQYLIIFTGMTIWAYFMKSPILVGFYAIFINASLILSSFSYDEYARFDKYVLTMPVSREMLVREKYVLLLILMGSSTVLGISLAGILNRMVGDEVFREIAVALLAIVCLFCISYSIVFPKIFQSGVEKARIQLVIVYLGNCVVAYGGMKAAAELNLIAKMMDSVWLISCLMVLLAIAGMVVSYVFSLKVIRKKEW